MQVTVNIMHMCKVKKTVWRQPDLCVPCWCGQCWDQHLQLLWCTSSPWCQWLLVCSCTGHSQSHTALKTQNQCVSSQSVVTHLSKQKTNVCHPSLWSPVCSYTGRSQSHTLLNTINKISWLKSLIKTHLLKHHWVRMLSYTQHSTG